MLLAAMFIGCSESATTEAAPVKIHVEVCNGKGKSAY